LSDQDVSDIAYYVNFIQTQADRPNGADAGGIALAHVGPVAEGFVAWLFGLGALVLFVRCIGTSGPEA
ncbi:MAG: cytochrome C, partial [Candidatus Eremiobacteraeota bacterium]|nr:cytochrome C [Candidatus Eremiobacteraeota bacterium]